MAFGKLQELIPTRPMVFRGQNTFNLTLFGVTALAGVALGISAETTWLFPVFALLSLRAGVLLILPIGGAAMPPVIALLNSYAGLPAAAERCAVFNTALV